MKYLRGQEDRYFNSIIVGVFNDVPDWVSLDLSAVDFLEERTEYFEKSMGLLRLSGEEKIFAIDGQHRVEAIKKVYLSDTSYSDQIAVTLVSHADSERGKRRTRRLFSDINKKAQRVSQGELVIIDEEEIENIVARKIFHWLEEKYEKSVGVSRTAAVARKDDYFVNLITIAKVCGIVAKIQSVKRRADPSEDETKRLFDAVKELFTFLIGCREDVSEALRKGEFVEQREERLNALFRPIGIEIFARIYVFCVEERRKTHLRQLLGDIDFSLNSRYFKDVVFLRGRINVKNIQLSCDLLLYALGVKNRKDVDLPDGYDNEFLRGKLQRL